MGIRDEIHCSNCGIAFKGVHCGICAESFGKHEQNCTPDCCDTEQRRKDHEALRELLNERGIDYWTQNNDGEYVIHLFELEDA